MCQQRDHFDFALRGIASGAQSNQAGGKPISHATNSGANAPGFSVVADDPAGTSPGTAAVTAAKSGPCERAASRIAPSVERTPLSASDAVGVGQQAIACARIDTSPAELPASLLPSFAGAKLVGVAQSAVSTCIRRSVRLTPQAPFNAALRAKNASGEPPGWATVGVAHSAISLGDDPQAISTVRPIDGTSRDNGRPAGVTDAFQVSKHSVEPVLANRRRNLLSHEDSGPSGTDESK
jgi:hypothetical protein